ncbi:MAG TPA: hypothetical protein DCE41_00590 [Cytophagales bacterium]|nr:hypothetical protein [Cytophagales bacterium]HAA18550.1 hypothetical protein [Cytophagales bacterium]HAP60299.1 hypothetical protein [Cytophagales bacterium]
MNPNRHDHNKLSAVSEKVAELLNGGDALVLIPPFYQSQSMPIGAYSLMTIAQRHGYKVDILQVDQLLASVMGLDAYDDISLRPVKPSEGVMAQRLFARSAHNMPIEDPSDDKDSSTKEKTKNNQENQSKADKGFSAREKSYHASPSFTHTEFLTWERLCFDFVEVVAEAIAHYPYRIVGASIIFETQVNASIALINAVKKRMPAVKCIVGGTFAEFGKEDGFLSLAPAIDHVFVGPSESTFLSYLDAVKHGKPLPPPVVPSKTMPFHKIPLPDYDAYMQNTAKVLGQEFCDREVKELWYEPDRGCWWADKVRCTFCAISDEAFRKKDIKQIVEELAQIKRQFPDKRILFAHNILWDSFIDDFLPYTSAGNLPPLGVLIRIQPDLEYIAKLKSAGVFYVLSGIETFSTRLLKRMKKGTTGRANLYFLRNAASFSIGIRWYLIWGFPGDTREEYDYLLELLPKITHLKPPLSMTQMMLMRGSPYVNESERYNIQDLKPWPSYGYAYPAGQIENMANYYEGEFESAALQDEELMSSIFQLVEAWQEHYAEAYLNLVTFAPGYYLIQDRRITNYMEEEQVPVMEEQAIELMSMRRYGHSPTQDWGLTKGYGILMDGWYVPVITAEPALLLELDQSEYRQAKHPLILQETR